MISFLGCAAALVIVTPCLLVRWASAYADQRDREIELEREDGWR